MPEQAKQSPTYDAQREERLKDILLDFALSAESGKTFDVGEMRLLRDDVQAMTSEIDALRTELARVRGAMHMLTRPLAAIFTMKSDLEAVQGIMIDVGTSDVARRSSAAPVHSGESNG